MSSNESQPSHKKITQFIPYKTMAMDLEAILANLTRIYVSRRDLEIWHQVERPEVAACNPALARCLALTTARMSVDEIGALLMRYANLG